MPRYKLWKLQKFDKAKAQELATQLQLSPLITGILLNRGLSTVDEIKSFLYGAPQVYHEPLLMQDMQKAGTRILKAIHAGEQITVYGDYDVDGITASSLLFLYLKEAGAKVNTYIPRRKGEGYGLNPEALRTIASGHTTLLITVDCGISGLEEVATAPAGMDIIITDHHMPPAELPAAYAIVNPKQPGCKYPFKGLSGVGIAFKLCQALYQMEHLTEPLWERYTELVALGTVADIVPLRGENRELVKRGLKAMEHTSLLGLQTLMQISACPEHDISADNIGFILAPRLNAVGRLEHAQLAVELLTTPEAAKARNIAEELNRENALRQEISRKIFEEAEAMLAQQKQIKTAIVLAKAGWHAGVIGIVASRLVDKYHLPTILISIDGEMAKGSCRSIPSLNLYEAIRECAEELIQFGGHHQAAGLTLRAARIEEFRQHFLHVVAGRLQPEDFEPKLKVDLLLEEQELLSLPLLKQLQLLEPFGCENPLPIFAMRNVVIRNPRIFGKEQNHLRFFVNYHTETYHSIMWNGSEFLACLYNSAVADIAFLPKINVYQGIESINLQVQALDQGLMIYDYRQGQLDKQVFLKQLLQTTEGVKIFLNPGEQLPEALRAYPNAQVAFYGAQGLATDRILVFYDLPLEKIFTESAFPVPGIQGRTLILLFSVEEYRKLRQELNTHCPDRKHLVDAYKFVMGSLHGSPRQEVQALQQAARQQGLELNLADLQIFRELAYIKLQDGQVELGTINRHRLEEAPTYVRLQEESKQLLDIYDCNFRITGAQINALWHKRCQEGF